MSRNKLSGFGTDDTAANWTGCRSEVVGVHRWKGASLAAPLTKSSEWDLLYLYSIDSHSGGMFSSWYHASEGLKGVILMYDRDKSFLEKKQWEVVLFI